MKKIITVTLFLILLLSSTQTNILAKNSMLENDDKNKISIVKSKYFRRGSEIISNTDLELINSSEDEYIYLKLTVNEFSNEKLIKNLHKHPEYFLDDGSIKSDLSYTDKEYAFNLKKKLRVFCKLKRTMKFFNQSTSIIQ